MYCLCYYVIENMVYFKKLRGTILVTITYILMQRNYATIENMVYFKKMWHNFDNNHIYFIVDKLRKYIYIYIYIYIIV